jgi:hypothetical protein
MWQTCIFNLNEQYLACDRQTDIKNNLIDYVGQTWKKNAWGSEGASERRNSVRDPKNPVAQLINRFGQVTKEIRTNFTTFIGCINYT